MLRQLAQPAGLLDRPAARPGELHVEVLEGGRPFSRHSVSAYAIIGRAADALIRLDRGTVSRQHAEVHADPFGRWWIRDLGSRNGLMLNGQRVTERALGTGELYQVGEFTIRFDLPVAADDSPTSSTRYNNVASIADHDSSTGISTANELGTPKVAASHLSLLLESGRDLMASADAEARLVLLCRLLLRTEFKGTCAMALRVLPGQLDSPVMLCPVQWAGLAANRLHVSRSLLKTVLEKNAPAIAATTTAMHGDTPAMVEMSVVTSMRPISAMACPLRTQQAGGATDVLYVVFPPECAIGEWLAIVALAAEQYRMVESSWTERVKALRHAAVERDLEQASQIQERLVPQDMKAPGLDVAVGFHPCRWVAGDYADAILLADGRVFLAVADVCGKGLSAALVASGIQTLTRAMLDDGAGLDRLMNRLNRYLGTHADDGRFATMVCAIVDPASGRIEHINAGHPPVILVDPAGNVRELGSAEFLPLGVEHDLFTIQEAQMEVGHLLAMYSDGLTEARTADGQMIGMKGCWKELAAIHVASPGHTVSQACGKVKRWLEEVSGGLLQDDDRTYLLARRS